MTDRHLTEKEQKVVAEFEKAQLGLGDRAKRNILNNDRTGWADIIADTPIDQLQVKQGGQDAN
jgi:hypothetical protein